MGNAEHRPLDSRTLRVRAGFVALATLPLAFACNGPTREYYEPEELTATGGTTSSGGTSSTGTAGTATTAALGGASAGGSAAGGIVGASGATNAAGGVAASGAPGEGGAAASGAPGIGGAIGTSGATGSGGSSNVGGTSTGAGTNSVGGAVSSGGTLATGGVVFNGGTSGTLGVGGGPAGKALGTACVLGAECVSLNCVDGVCCTASACPECMNCGTTGLCNSAVTNAQDTSPNACSGTRTCNAAGVCTGPKPLGQACAGAAECASGFCADGVCCGTACNGTCQTCDAAGACQRTVMREDDSCRTDATGTRMCDAQSFCSMPHLIRDINPLTYTVAGITNSFPSYPRNFTQGPDRRVYFSANDGTAGEELWVTDGTAAGTAVFADILAGIGNSSPRGLVNASSSLFFAAVDSTGYARLYATNGNAAGTHLVKDLGNNAFGGNMLSARSAGNVIYFSGCNSTAGCELWRSDGSDTGTFMVADIMNTVVSTTSTQTFSSNPSELAIMGNVAYFRAASSIVGPGTTNTIADYELWKSDGIATNTVRVADVEPGVGNGMPTYLTPMQTLNGMRLVFAATRSASGQELYFTNGTANDLTTLDINPGAASSYPGPFVPMGNRTYFSATDATNGSELWATDGTSAGTYLVKDIFPGTTGSGPALLKAAGNFLYFHASDSGGYGVWRSDGTSNGTTKVFSVSAFTPAGAGLFQMAAFGNSNRVFMGTAGPGTQELWVTDGTPAGTYRTCPDRTQPCGVPFPSNPSDMTVIDGRMYFNATALPTVGGSLGAEPYVYP